MLYLHLLMLPVDSVLVRGVPLRAVTRVRLLATGEDLGYSTNLDVSSQFVDADDLRGELRIVAPRPSGAALDVIAIDFA